MPVMTITLVVILVILLLLSVPVAVSLGLASVATMLIYHPVTLELIPQLLYNNSTGFVMLAVPLFILAGNLMECGTIGRNLIDFVNSLVGNQTGGLGTVNIVGSMLFGGVSGSSLADTAVFGSILVPRMEAQGYPKDYAAGVTAISSCLSVIIPPSINIVVAAAVTSVSIARGMAAGVLPGILLTLSMCVANWYLAGKHHYGTKIPFSWKNVGQTLKTTWTALLAPGIILGCIFSGIVTPTEAAAITVLYVLIVDALIYRKLTLKDIWRCLKDTGRMTSNILFIATSSAVASWIITYEGIPALMAQALANVPGGKYGFELLLIVFIMILGAVMDAGPILIIFTPLFMPVAKALGIDPIHYIMIIITGTAVGLTTPPYGVCLFSLATITKMKIGDIARAMIPFYICVAVALLLIAFIPGISLWLPSLLGLS